MGQGGEGWAEARNTIVPPNIRGYDIVLLQEVQWVEKGTKDRLAAPAGCELVMTRSENGNRNLCILYNPDKLQCKDGDTKTVTEMLKSIEGWTTHPGYSKRLCLQVFTLKGKGDTSKFVAISLHAPKTNTKHFCEMVKAGIEKVVADHKLPVLVGGDFNTDIYDWEKDGFLGLHEARHKRIDFITIKVPKENHLEMGDVSNFEHIDIPAAAQDLEVKRKGEAKPILVRRFREKYPYDFHIHLCDSHMPLTVVVTYHDQCVDQKQERIQEKREVPSAADLRKMSQDDEKVAHLTVENRALKQKVAELEEQCRRYQKRIEELNEEVRDLREHLQS